MNPVPIDDIQMPQFVERFMSVAQVITSLGLQGFSFLLPCAGIHGYLMRLHFWMVLPACAALLIVLLAMIRIAVRSRCRMPKGRLSVALMQDSLPWILRLVFLIYHVVSRSCSC